MFTQDSRRQKFRTTILSNASLGVMTWNTIAIRDVGSISNLGARHFEGTFFVKKRGHFLKMKNAFLWLLQNLAGARAPSAPGSYVSE